MNPYGTLATGSTLLARRADVDEGRETDDCLRRHDEGPRVRDRRQSQSKYRDNDAGGHQQYLGALAYRKSGRARRAKDRLGQTLARRDYFGAHTYERTDGLPGEFVHSDWHALLKTVTSVDKP